MVGVPVTCNTFHFPSGIYAEHAAPTSSLCSVCRTGPVPDMLLLTIEPFTGMPIKGTGTLIQARVAVRRNRTFKGRPVISLRQCNKVIRQNYVSNSSISMLMLNNTK